VGIDRSEVPSRTLSFFTVVARGLSKTAREELEGFIEDQDGERDPENGAPFLGIESSGVEDALEERNIENDEVEDEREGAGSQDPDVAPRRDDEERLIFREGVQSVEHFDQDENGQRDSRGASIMEDVASTRLPAFEEITTTDTVVEVSELFPGNVLGGR